MRKSTTLDVSTSQIEDHARRMSNRIAFLEATIRSALLVHVASTEKVCVCPRCEILRAPLKRELPGSEPYGNRSGGEVIVRTDDPEWEAAP